MDVDGQRNEHVSLDTVLKDTLDVVTNSCNLLGRETSKLVVQKRQKALQNGDFCIPSGCFKMNQEEFDHLKERLLVESKPWACPIKDVRSDSHNSMLIALDRPATYKSVISSLVKSEIPRDLKTPNDRQNNISKGERIDQTNEMPINTRRSCDRTVLVNVPDCCDCQSLEQLRGLVLTQHALQLLQAKGIRSKLTSHQETRQLQKWLELLNFDCDISRGGNENCDLEHTLDLARNSEYKVPQGHKNGREGSKSETALPHDLDKSDWLVLDSEKFLASKSTESGVFDKNLGKIHLVDGNGSTDTLIQISHLQNCIEEMGQCDYILHIIPDRKSFQQQKIDLGLQMLVNDAPRQVHLVYGSVSERKSSTAHKSNANEFYNLRFDQMKEASVMKYGECVKGAGWKKTIENLTAACVKFELLLNVPRNTVKLDLSEGSDDSGGGIDNRAGAFVMYNCARLATLFKHFHKAVEDGVYPPLPTVEAVDFGLLREEDEWSLFFNYLFPYTDVLQSTVAELLPPNKGIYTKLGTHKISNFLIGLSRSLSCYYSRVHILVENRPNLLPTMFARLYLMMSLHSVMKSALLLMGISPPSQL